MNLGFLARNPLFGIVPAIAYLLAGWQNGFAVGQCFGQRCIKEVGILGLSQWTEAVYAGVNSGAIIFILGWIVGSLLLGTYLLVSLNLFGMHRNDAFSSLRIQDWKGFLRFTIDPDGRLRMRFIGFEKVPRKWETEVVGGRKILRPAREENFVGEVVDEIDIPGGTAKVSAEAAPRDAKPLLALNEERESVEM